MGSVLVIDDNRQTADALAQMLKVLGLEARPAYGASPAMTLLAHTLPDLVLLDINMPGLSGLEVLAYLRREPRLHRVPVVVITADEQPETRQQALQAGAQGFLVKPITLDDLERELQRLGVLA
jgi:CheY-like chemotaxis protein